MVKLVRYEAARHALAEASRVDEIKEIRNQAVAMLEYAKQAKDESLVRMAAEIKTRAEHKAGEKLAEQPKAKGSAGQTSTRHRLAVTGDRQPPTLADLGITKTQSVKWQALAKLPPAKFEEKVKQIVERAANAATSAPRHSKSEFTGENEWYTPPRYIELARLVLGDIDLDPASSEQAQKAVKAGHYFTLADDGLAQSWHGRVWLNPPYAQPAISQFAAKMAEEFIARRVKAAIMLTHNYTDTAWFQALAHASDAICFTRGRVQFESPSGEIAAPTQGQAFFYFGDDVESFSQHFTEVGFICAFLS